MEIDKDKKDGLNKLCDELINQGKTTPDSYKLLMNYIKANNLMVVANPLDELYKRYCNKLDIKHIDSKSFVEDFKKFVFED